MDAGHAFYKISGQRYSIITGYRKNFLENQKVRFVWKKYLRDRMFGETAWTKAVDAYIAEFEASPGKSLPLARHNRYAPHPAEAAVQPTA